LANESPTKESDKKLLVIAQKNFKKNNPGIPSTTRAVSNTIADATNTPHISGVETLEQEKINKNSQENNQEIDKQIDNGITIHTNKSDDGPNKFDPKRLVLQINRLNEMTGGDTPPKK